MWAQNYTCCRKCGTTERKHLARGLCNLCYQKDIERKHSPNKAKKGTASSTLTNEFLIEHYCVNKESLSDIAIRAKCSRQYVFKRIKKLKLKMRNKSTARELALNRRKIKFERAKQNGEYEVITLSKSKVNNSFFKTWSAKMAYILGVICTDGNINPVGRVTISQKEPELLEKVLKVMDSETKLLFRERKVFSNTVAGQTYYFHLNSNELYDDLIRFGLTPNKSLTMKFPEIPEEYISHFVRGCWDGDGSVYIDRSSNSISASFTSGSKDFISEILNQLYKQGLPTRTLHRKGNSFYFRYTGNQCKLLANYLYRDSNESMRLNRKFDLFQRVF